MNSLKLLINLDLPKDLDLYTICNETWHQVAIMDQERLKSFKKIPTACAKILITNHFEPLPEGIFEAGSLDTALNFAEELYPQRTTYLIGGKSMYKEALDIADEVIINSYYKDYKLDLDLCDWKEESYEQLDFVHKFNYFRK